MTRPLFFDRLRDVAMATTFGGDLTTICISHIHCTFLVLAFHNLLDDHNANRCINGRGDPSTSGRNLVCFGPVTPEITTLECVIFGTIYGEYWYITPIISEYTGPNHVNQIFKVIGGDD